MVNGGTTLNNRAKLSHNLQVLTLSNKKSKTDYIYVPTQYGRLSKHLKRTTTEETITIPDGDSQITYKLLEVYENKRTRKLVWWHKKIHQDKRGRIFEYSFEKYTPKSWEQIREKATKIKEKEEVKTKEVEEYDANTQVPVLRERT